MAIEKILILKGNAFIFWTQVLMQAIVLNTIFILTFGFLFLVYKIYDETPKTIAVLITLLFIFANLSLYFSINEQFIKSKEDLYYLSKGDTIVLNPYLLKLPLEVLCDNLTNKPPKEKENIKIIYHIIDKEGYYDGKYCILN